MLNRVDKNEKRQKRHLRSRQYIIGTAEKPRLNVYRSLSNIYAQVINDVTGETIVAASTVEKDLKANYGAYFCCLHLFALRSVSRSYQIGRAHV